MPFLGFTFLASLILGLFLLLFWLLLRTLLLWVGAKYLVKIPGATYWRCLLALLVGGLISFGLSSILGFVGYPAMTPLGIAIGSILGVVVSLLLTWYFIKIFLKTSLGKAILAWLPTLGIWVMILPLTLAIILPALSKARELSKQVICRGNLQGISKACMLYLGSNSDAFPPSLDVLIKSHDCTPEMLYCPAVKEKYRPSYFYFPPVSGNGLHIRSVMACDFELNHKGEGRNVLFSDGSMVWMKPDQFANEMDKTENRTFALMLADAE